jgi:uncharacterized protein (TIGR02246 family)
MKPTFSLLALLLGVSLFLPACQAPPAHDHAPEVNLDTVKAIINALEIDYARASNAKDAEGILKYYAPDAEIYSTEDGTQVGTDAIRAGLERMFAADTAETTVAFAVTGVWAAGNLAVETGTSTTTGKDGAVTSTGKYMVLYELRDGKYLAIREMHVDDKPAAAADAAAPAQ